MTFPSAPPPPRARPPHHPRRRLLALGLAAAVACAFACAGSAASKPPRFPSGAFATKPPGRILFVLSAANQQTLADGSKRATGTFLGEFYDPYRALLSAGHQVELATIDGRRPAIDPESLKPKYWDDVADRDRAQTFVQTSPALQAPLDLRAALARADDFQGLVVPGGQGMMVELLANRDLEALLTRFAADDRPIGLICHAPALLTRLRAPGKLAGRRVTSVSGLEE
jgi:putative intracellular protease/amidase